MNTKSPTRKTIAKDGTKNFLTAITRRGYEAKLTLTYNFSAWGMKIRNAEPDKKEINRGTWNKERQLYTGGSPAIQ